MKRYFIFTLLMLSGFALKAQKSVDYDDVYATKEERYELAVLNDFARRNQMNENNRRRFENNSHANGYSPRYDYYRSNHAASRMYRNNFNSPCWGPTWSTCNSGGWRSAIFMGGGMSMMNTPWSWYAWNNPMGNFYNPYADPFFNPYDPFMNPYMNPYMASMNGGWGFGGGFYNPWTPIGYNPWLYSGRIRPNDTWRNAHVIRYPYGEIPNDRRSEYYQTRTRENRDYRGTDNRSVYPGSSGNSGWSEPSYRNRDSGGGGRGGGGSVNPGGSGGSRTRRGG